MKDFNYKFFNSYNNVRQKVGNTESIRINSKWGLFFEYAQDYEGKFILIELMYATGNDFEYDEIIDSMTFEYNQLDLALWNVIDSFMENAVE